jgi:membrane fusion protein, multidrug efflux system
MKINKYLFLMLLAFLGMEGCKNERVTEAGDNQSIAVRVEKVRSHSEKKQLSVSGNIEGFKTTRLGFMVAGKVNFIAMEEGQTVAAGELLASLDPESYSIAKDMADANLDQTQDEFNRLNQMHEHQSISESDFNKITNALKVAKAQQRLQAKNLLDTRLYSPISGVLLKKGVEAGEIIGAGMPLFVVSNIKTVKVNVSVPESDIHQLRIGNEASVYVLSLDSAFIGKIVEIGSLAEAATRTFTVKIEVQNPHLLIRPGMTAEVQINTGVTEQCIGIPADAVQHETDNSSYVYVADTIKNQAFKRTISIGNILDNSIEVISGLTQGELIIVSGQQKLSSGSSITLK